MAEDTESVRDSSYEDDLKSAVEDRLLRVNARLEDGSTGKVFSVIPTEQGPRWRCHPCCVTVTGSRKIYHHERSKAHADTMVQPQPHSVAKFRPQSPPPKPRQTVLEMSLAPGEPVPPGFEGEVRGVTKIQSKLDAFTSTSLIGLEYLVELHDYDDTKEPQYICILCDKRGDPRTVMAHLVSLNHRRKFLQSHFPKVMLKLHSIYLTANSKEFRKGLHSIVAKITEWIEKRFGRLAPHACDKESFERKRMSYTQTIVKDVHFSDKGGETFVEFIDESLLAPPPSSSSASDAPVITKSVHETKSVQEDIPGCKPPLRIKCRSPSPPIVNAPGFKKRPNARQMDRRSLSPISSVSSSSLSDSSSIEDISLHKNFRRTNDTGGHPEYVRRNRSRSGSSKRFVKQYSRYRSRSRSPRGRFRGGNKMPWTRPDYSHNYRRESESSHRTKISTETARWDEYKRGVQKIEADLEHSLRNHEKNPEKHPQYPEEWKKFWNRRYKELQAEHKDPSKHDFKPEWIDFWNKRMKEMHDVELKKKKDSLRKRLNLPEEPQPIKFKIMSKKPTTNVKRDDSLNTDPDVIVIDDSKDEDSKSIHSISSEKRERKRSHSPWEAEYQHDSERFHVKREREYYGKSRLYIDRSKYVSPNIPSYRNEEPEDDGQLNIIAVLRLLTALEEKLGSLGPKVIDMLSTALAMEKAEANSAETLLDNDVNCVLFETVKEKLKGQLLAGMIELNAEKPAKSAVKKIASLLHLASERKRQQRIEEENKTGEKTKPVTVPGIGDVDKEAIAKQIAAALVAQGRTDVTQSELEQLIEAVVGMSQQSQNADVPITTAEYAAQLQSKDSGNSKQNVNSSITPTALQVLQSTYGNETSSNAMDGLSDSDLKTLLQNFKDLSTDEQHGLISYLKKLEAREPERVERLRKFVNLGPSKTEKDTTEVMDRATGKNIVNSKRVTIANFMEEEKIFENIEEDRKSIPPVDLEPVKIDSEEDDDYTFEDVFNAASKNLKEKQLAEERQLIEDTMTTKKTTVDPNLVLKDAKMMIANIMGQLGQKNATLNVTSNSTSNVNLLGFDARDEPPSMHEKVIPPQNLGVPCSSNSYGERKPPSSQYDKPNAEYGSVNAPSYDYTRDEYTRISSGTDQYNADRHSYQLNYNSTMPSNLRPNFHPPTYQDSNNYSDPRHTNYNNGNFDIPGNQSYQQNFENYSIPMQYNQMGPQGYSNNSTYPEDTSSQGQFANSQGGYSDPSNRATYSQRGYY